MVSSAAREVGGVLLVRYAQGPEEGPSRTEKPQKGNRGHGVQPTSSGSLHQRARGIGSVGLLWLWSPLSEMGLPLWRNTGEPFKVKENTPSPSEPRRSVKPAFQNAVSLD